MQMYDTSAGVSRSSLSRWCNRSSSSSRRRPVLNLRVLRVRCVQIWNCSQDQSNHIVHEFFKSDHFNDGIPIIPGVCASSSHTQQTLESCVAHFSSSCSRDHHCDIGP